jgi:hypothetical protein
MPISAKQVGETLAVGGELSQDQVQALSSISVSAEDVLTNLEDLNDEIVESGYDVNNAEQQALPKTAGPKAAAPTAKRVKKQQSKSALRTQIPPERQPKGAANMDFDQELEAAANELDARATSADADAAEVEGADTMKGQIMELLSNTPGAPNLATIERWKAQLGKNAVHVMAFGEGDVYIFTHLKRGQWKKIQELMAKAQETGSTDVEDALKEKVVTYCTLWPKPLPVEFFYNSKAGVVDSLYQVILLNSYFLSPQQAMMLTTQL